MDGQSTEGPARRRGLAFAGACLGGTAAVTVLAVLLPEIVFGLVAGVGLARAWRGSKPADVDASLLEAAGVIRIRIDTSGRVIHWPVLGESIFGYAAEAILGRNVSMLMPEPLASEHDDHLRRYLASIVTLGPSRVLGATRQVVGRHRDGRPVPLLLHVQPRRTRQGVVFDGLLQRVPEAGGHRDMPLPDEGTPVLDWRWLRNLGHEIRTPMAGVQGHAEILTDPHSTEAERQSSAEAILRNSNHLLDLLNDLLDHARLAAGEMPIRPQQFDVADFVRGIEAMMRSTAERHELSLHTSIAPDVPRLWGSDPTRLRQILLNLLGNALKFTKCGWVRLEVRVVAVDGRLRLRLDVCDSGAGISAEFAKQLFQPFHQEARVQGGPSGSGLGLSICRRLARLLGGDLELVDSAPGVGSRFRCEIANLHDDQCAATPQRAVASASAQGGELAAVRILVVDDSSDLRMATVRFLRAAGATVIDFEDPRAALAAYQGCGQEYDLVLLDMMMPHLDGCELAAALQSSGCRAPLIALSADAGPEFEARCQKAGFVRWLQKPIRRADLVRSLGEIHTKASAQVR